MNQEILDKAVRISRTLIGEKTTTTDEEIDKAISNVKQLFTEDTLDVIRLKQELQTIYSTQIESFQILVGRERRKPWLNEFKAQEQSEWNFWKRYREYLEEKGFAPRVIEELDALTDKILDNTFNPRQQNIQISKKGLVVGLVQSGKTANYTGLICKAADAGFNFIIVLAGIHNNLRSQTQSRLDEGFLGFDTQFERVYANNADNKIGVGLNTRYSNLVAHSITTSEEKGDFTKRAAGIVNFNTSDPILLVIKKNVSVMKRLYAWLRTQSNDNKINTKSVLIIDDEADNASINTNRPELDPSSTNGLIRNIINEFNRCAYVGYTATPYANIFIAQDDTDLFPRDFIVNLPAPSNYVGPEKVFGTSLEPNENDDTLPIVVKVSDYSGFVPENHKKNDDKPTYEDIPRSLKTAIKCFIVTCAIRIARGQENKHNSMLIHLSRFQVWQNVIKDLIEELFRFYKQEIEANDRATLEEFRQIFEVDTDNYTSYTSTTKSILQSSLSDIDKNMKVHSWEEIKPLLKRAAQKIVVKSINGSSGDVIDYQQHEKTGISVIAIGGDKLSRGLTLEGLSISYFLRASKMYDTLMQMGRWFGYRPGYVDLCRLFTSTELNEWFRHITLASEELRDEFNYLAESGQTPEQYALKVRQHDGALQITAINKMRNTRQVEVSWAGKLRETYQLPMDKGLEHRNYVATAELINSIGKPQTTDNNYYLWFDVNPEKICNYLDAFNVAKSLKKVNLDLINKYIKNLVNHGELTSWRIALMNRSGAEKKYNFGNEIIGGCFKRTRANESGDDTYFIRKNHIVGHQTDEFIDLDEETIENAKERTIEIMKQQNREWNKNYPSPKIVREEFRSVKNPLLIIYPLNPQWANVLDKTGKVKAETIQYTIQDEPIIGFAIVFPHSNIRDNAVAYTVNMVAEYEETDDNFENENDNDYDEQ